jgi:metal-sulfur cluster biosynthetic enzyme
MLTRGKVREVLEKIKDPETGLSLHELRVVRTVDYDRERGRLIICLDYNRRTPSCFGCQPIAWMVQRKIADDLHREFSRLEGVTEVEFTYS